MKRKAEIDVRGERLFAASYSVTVEGWTVLDDWIEAANEPVENGVLGRMVREALAHCRTGIPQPDFRAAPSVPVRKLLGLAAVRSYAIFARGVRQVEVALDDSRGELVITPTRNGGPRSGFTAIEDKAEVLPGDADNEALGGAVREALKVATS